MSTEEYMADVFGQLAAYFRSLPPARFPSLAGHADEIVSGHDDERGSSSAWT
jgi:hypothetical protein